MLPSNIRMLSTSHVHIQHSIALLLSLRIAISELQPYSIWHRTRTYTSNTTTAISTRLRLCRQRTCGSSQHTIYADVPRGDRAELVHSASPRVSHSEVYLARYSTLSFNTHIDELAALTFGLSYLLRMTLWCPTVTRTEDDTHSLNVTQLSSLCPRNLDHFSCRRPS